MINFNQSEVEGYIYLIRYYTYLGILSWHIHKVTALLENLSKTQHTFSNMVIK